KNAGIQRRSFMRGAAALAAGLGGVTEGYAQSFPYTPNQRYPDPAVHVLDPSFAKYRIYSSTVEQLGSGMRWAEGPVYFPGDKPGDPGYVLVSDIPNNRIMKFDERTGAFTV